MEPDLWSLTRKTKYPIDAFIFVQRGLDHTVRAIHGEPGADYDPEDDSVNRHVSGRQLCEGLRDYAIQQYGLMARSVLRHWRIYNCEDFGRIVFAMVDSGMMRKTDQDTIDDFCGVFDFAEAFGRGLILSENG